MDKKSLIILVPEYYFHQFMISDTLFVFLVY